MWGSKIKRWVDDIEIRDVSNIHRTPQIVNYANMHVINENAS